MRFWFDLGQQFHHLEGSLAGTLKVRVSPKTEDNCWWDWDISSFWGNDLACEKFSALADVAGSKLIEEHVSAPDGIPWESEAERWYAELFRASGERGPVEHFWLTGDGKVGEGTGWSGELSRPASVSARLCFQFAESAGEPPPTAGPPSQAGPESDHWPALDARGSQEAVLRYLAQHASPKSTYEIEANNAGNLRRKACVRALRELARKGYGCEPNGKGRGWAATDKGKEWVTRNPEPE